ncbi:MAG: ABC transporter permease [Bacillota bacterium]|nr:ABC transporter permease [Bacillota bacterium]
MNSFSLAFSNFKRNIKTYGLYIISMIFSVLVYYNFISLKYNPDFQKAKGTFDYIRGVSDVVSYLLLFFLIFFIWFTSSFFLNQRKKEIGIYAFMGVTNYQIGLIYAAEVIFIGLTAIVFGLLLGVIFCRLFLMMLAKAAIMNMKIGFFISYKALIQTAVTFFIIFFINSLLGYINIVRSRLIDLFNASKREEQLPKVNYIKGLLSIICIGTGYYFATHAIGVKFLTYIPLAVLFVVMGTYWLFESVYSIVMKLIISNKKILYKGVNIVSISNIAFRIKNNYRALSAVAVMIAVTLTSYGTVASLKYFVNIRDSLQSPYAISYISDNQDVKNQVKNAIKKDNLNITTEENTKFCLIKTKIDSGFGISLDDTSAIRYSDFLRISRNLNAKKLEEIEKNKPESGEILYIESPAVVMSLVNYENVKTTISGKEFIIKNTFKTPLFGAGLAYPCIVMSDNDYNSIKSAGGEFEFNGININNTDNLKSLAEKLKKITPIKESLYASTSKDISSYNMFGIIYFLGAFLALVFIIATGTIIYFKLISEAYLDKEKYSMLKKLGMTKKEVYRALSKQISITYLLPLIVGIIHSCVAMSVLSDKMHYNIIIPSLYSILLFVLVYGIYFIGTARKYLKIVM